MSELPLSGEGMERGVVRAGGRGCLRGGEGVESSDHGGGRGNAFVGISNNSGKLRNTAALDIFVSLIIARWRQIRQPDHLIPHFLHFHTRFPLLLTERSRNDGQYILKASEKRVRLREYPMVEDRSVYQASSCHTTTLSQKSASEPVAFLDK